MTDIVSAARIYRRVAEAYERQGPEQLRDRFVVLAAEAALACGQADEAEELRLRLLRYNPHHLLEPFATLSQALATVDVRAYVDALRRSHPVEQAKALLATLDPLSIHSVEGERQLIVHESHEEHEDPAIYRLRDSIGEKGGLRQQASLASNAAARPDRGGWSRVGETRPTGSGKQAQKSSSAFAPRQDIYAIRNDELPELKRDDADVACSPVSWPVIGLFFITLCASLLLAGYVFVWPLLFR